MPSYTILTNALATFMLVLGWPLYDGSSAAHSTSPIQLLSDGKLQCPASSVNTYLDTLRTCRSAEFHEISVCQDERLSMRCPPSTYIVVYTADWVTSADHTGQHSCQPVSEGCTGPQVSCVLQTISLRCQRRRYCSLVGNEQDIHGPCLPEQPGLRLHVVYICRQYRALERVH